MIEFLNPTNKIGARELTLRVGDKRDNLEFVRRGGRGGVLPKLDSELIEVLTRLRMEKGFGCLTGLNSAPFDLVCGYVGIW